MLIRMMRRVEAMVMMMMSRLEVKRMVTSRLEVMSMVTIRLEMTRMVTSTLEVMRMVVSRVAVVRMAMVTIMTTGVEVTRKEHIIKFKTLLGTPRERETLVLPKSPTPNATIMNVIGKYSTIVESLFLIWFLAPVFHPGRLQEFRPL
jgi:hypothetical protein